MSLLPFGLNPKVRPSRLVLAAAVLHIIVVLAVFVTGRSGILPNAFDRYGIGTFAIDSQSYRIEASALAATLRDGRLSEWQANPRLHVKLYAISFFVLDGILGPNILSAEPLNLGCFLLILILIYRIGKEVFDQRAGVMAAAVVGVWPSFLLHTTQMLRDPLFIVLMLLLMLVFIILLTRELTWNRGLVAGMTGAIAGFSLWLIRGDWWEVILLVLLIGVCMPFLQQVLERRFRFGNALGALLILGAGLALPQIVSTYRQSETYVSTPGKPNTLVPASQPGKLEATRGTQVWSRVPERIGYLRHKFIVRYPLAGSNIDTDVKLNSKRAIIGYLPRAIVIGLFSPFPNMWFTPGSQVGREGRVFAGIEMLVFYLIEGLALICVFLQRRRLPVWLVFITVLVGVTALGYVVVNISTIYRMRYVFAMLLTVMGAQGFIEIQSRLILRKAAAQSG